MAMPESNLGLEKRLHIHFCVLRLSKGRLMESVIFARSSRVFLAMRAQIAQHENLSDEGRVSMGKKRILYIDARYGINTKILGQALKQMLEDACRIEDLAGGEKDLAFDGPVLQMVSAITKLVDSMGILKVYEREQALGLLRICRILSRLGVTSILTGTLPLPIQEENTRDEELATKRELLAGFSGTPSSTTGVSLACALLFKALSVRQSREIGGEPLLTASVSGREGRPLSLILLVEAEGCWEEIVQMESHIDHLTGEEAGLVIETLSNDKRVLDVLWLSGIGKKNRPMGLLRIMCHIKDRTAVRSLLLRHTHTLGFREQILRRLVVDRRSGEGQLADGTPVRTKEYVIDGQWYSRPECDDIRDRACAAGLGAPAFRFARVRMEKG